MAPLRGTFSPLLAGLVTAAVTAVAGNTDDCISSSADPADLIEFDAPWSFKDDAAKISHYYWEERDNPAGVLLPYPNPADADGQAPIPLNSFLLPGGGGTWVYEERNGLEGLQRGGCAKPIGAQPMGSEGLVGCPPLACVPPPAQDPLFCIQDDETVFDETCGRGPDARVL